MSINWDMQINISIVYQDEDLPQGVDGSIYSDGKYGYYERTLNIMSDNYYSSYSFNLDRMGDVVDYIYKNSPEELDSYILSIGGKLVEQYKYTT